MKNKIAIIFATTLSLLALSVFAHNTEKQESLYGVNIYKNQIEIIVKNNGCTKAQDFRLEQLHAGNHILLNIVRIKPDKCRAMTRPMRISLPLNANKVSYYKINNHLMRSNILSKMQKSTGEHK